MFSLRGRFLLVKARWKPGGINFFVCHRSFTSSGGRGRFELNAALERYYIVRNKLLKAFSLTVRSELKFENYKLHKGYRLTQWLIVGINISVFLLWRISIYDPTLYDFMNKYLCWQNDWFESGSYFHFITTGFSHQTLEHLIGNMFIVLLLTKKLYQLLGPGKFWGLYLCGSIGGNVAADVSGAYTKEEILNQDQMRTANILCNIPPGVMRGLGASDSCMALIIVYYLTFPRHTLHFSRLLWLMEKIPRLSPYLQRVKISALWLLPAYFGNDIINVLRPVGLFEERTNNSDLLVDHWAHLGGAITGLGFYALMVRQLRAKYYMKLTGLDYRKWYLMSVSLCTWGALFWWARTREMKAIREKGDQVLCIDWEKLKLVSEEFPNVVDDEVKQRLWMLSSCLLQNESPCFVCDGLAKNCHEALCERIVANLGPTKRGQEGDENWRDNFANSIIIKQQVAECVMAMEKRYLYEFQIGDEVEADCEGGWLKACIVEHAEDFSYRIKFHNHSEPHPDIWTIAELRKS